MSPVLPRERSVRLLAASMLVNTIGKGLYLTGSALFFRRSVGLSTDRRVYLAVTALNGIMVLTLAMPLGLVGHSGAPRWPVSPLMLCNTVLVVLLQVRASRGCETVPGAARAVRRSGWALAALFVTAGALTPPMARVALVRRPALAPA